MFRQQPVVGRGIEFEDACSRRSTLSPFGVAHGISQWVRAGERDRRRHRRRGARRHAAPLQRRQAPSNMKASGNGREERCLPVLGSACCRMLIALKMPMR
jgi:hypothetical protein